MIDSEGVAMQQGDNVEGVTALWLFEGAVMAASDDVTGVTFLEDADVIQAPLAFVYRQPNTTLTVPRSNTSLTNTHFG